MKLYVKRMSTGEVVSAIDVTGRDADGVARVMRGLMRQMDTDRFFVDMSETDALFNPDAERDARDENAGEWDARGPRTEGDL